MNLSMVPEIVGRGVLPESAIFVQVEQQVKTQAFIASISKWLP
jgi:hypothetical protein